MGNLHKDLSTFMFLTEIQNISNTIRVQGN